MELYDLGEIVMTHEDWNSLLFIMTNFAFRANSVHLNIRLVKLFIYGNFSYCNFFLYKKNKDWNIFHGQ